MKNTLTISSGDLAVLEEQPEILEEFRHEDLVARDYWLEEVSNVKIDFLGDYLKEIGKYKLLGKEIEAQLAERAQGTDVKAKDEFIKANLRLVVWVAKNYNNWIYGHPVIDLMDLIQEGNMALYRTLRTFDPMKGKFSTYAVGWINQYIRRFIDNSYRTVRTPVHVAEMVRKVWRTKKTLTQHGKDGTVVEISEETGFDIEHVAILVQLSQQNSTLSLSQPVFSGIGAGGGEAQWTMGDSIVDTRLYSPEELVDKDRIETQVYKRMKVLLNIKEFQVVVRRFGFGKLPEHTLEEIGWLYGVTRERIRQIEAKAVKKLQEDTVLQSLFLQSYGQKLPFEVEKVRNEKIRTARKRMEESQNHKSEHEAELERLINKFRTSERETPETIKGRVADVDLSVVMENLKKRGSEELKRRNELLKFASSLDFDQATQVLLLGLDERLRDILMLRFGLLDGRASSLDAVGIKYGITRERVRQLQVFAFKQLRASMAFSSSIVQTAFSGIRHVMEELGNVVPGDLLISCLSDDKKMTSRVRLLLYAAGQFSFFSENDHFVSRWSLLEPELEARILDSIETLSSSLEDKDVLMSEDQITSILDETLTRFGVAVSYRKPEFFLTFLKLSKNIGKNILDKYGKTSSATVNPRGVGDFAYLVMAELKRPMHFREIASETMKFIGRKFSAKTLHNSMILDKRFVVVGSGIYALADWGYRPGFVKDIVKEVLSSSSVPLSLERVVQLVSLQRMVKEHTIVVALNDPLFEKLDNGLWVLAGSRDSKLSQQPISKVVSAVCGLYNLDEKLVYGKSRKKDIVRVRHIIMYLLYDKCGFSYPVIAEGLNRDHTSVIHGHNKVKSACEQDSEFRSEVGRIVKVLRMLTK